MRKTNDGPFSPAPEQRLNNWLYSLAQARAEQDGTDIASAMGKVKRENPPLVDAVRMEVMGIPADARGPKFMQLMRRAMEIAKAKGISPQPAIEQAAAENPDLAAAARMERGGNLYAGEFRVPPGVGDRMVLMSEGIEAALDPGAHLVRLAEERQREKSISYGEALVEVGREHSQLVRAAREQSLGCKLD